MNKLLQLAAAGLFPALLTAQNAAKTPSFPIKIDGTISHYNGKKLYLHHKVMENDVVDSLKIKDGKFSFKLKNTQPDIYWFSDSRDNSQNVCFFFADQTPLTATLKGDSLAYSTVEGGQTQKDYMAYRNIINGFVMTQMKLQNDFNEAVQKNDMNWQNNLRNEYQGLNGQYVNALKSFVRIHSTSPVAAWVVGTDLNNPNIPDADVEEAYQALDKKLAESNSYAKAANTRLEGVRRTMVGHMATNFTQATPDGKQISLSDFRGQYVLIDFWASWCRPCRMENPNVVQAYNKFRDKGFTVLGVSMDTDASRWVGAIQQDNLTWTQVSDLKGWANEAGKLYNVTGIPQNFLIDKEGKIVAKNLRGADLEQKLAEILK